MDTQVHAYIFGTVHFSRFLFLTDVLYVPEFTFNLISNTKLTAVLQCCIIFKSTSCFIQDLTTLKMIGSAKVVEGLYTYKILTHHFLLSLLL